MPAGGAAPLPDFPWDRLAPYGDLAARPSRVASPTSASGRPSTRRPEPVRAALRARGGRPGLPAHGRRPRAAGGDPGVAVPPARRVRPVAVLPTVGSKELVALLPWLLGVRRRRRLPGPGVPDLRGRGAARRLRARPLAVDGLPWTGLGRWRGVAALGELAGQPDRRRRSTPDDPARRSSPGPGERGVLVVSDECYIEFGWDAEPVSVLHPVGVRGQPRGAARRPLAVEAVEHGRLPGRFRGGRPGRGGPAAGGAQARRPDGARPRPGGHDRRIGRRRACRRAARALPAPPRGARCRRWRRPDSGSRPARPGSTCGAPATRTAGRACGGWPSAGILVAPGEFYGAAGACHVRVALTATDERVAAAAERLTGSGGRRPCGDWPVLQASSYDQGVRRRRK